MTAWEIWRAQFGDLPPIAHVVRPALAGRWVRIHSLPGGKQHPENRREMSGLLERHNQVAVEILGTGSTVALFLFAFLEQAQNQDLAPVFAKFSWANAVNFTEGVPLVHTDNHGRTVVTGSRVLWYPGAWDPLVRDVAKARLNAVILLNPNSGEIYAPYDGGADLFVNRADRAAGLRSRWADWLPDRSSLPPT